MLGARRFARLSSVTFRRHECHAFQSIGARRSVVSSGGVVGDGRTLELETGRLAKLADGAVLAKHGDTVVLATVVASRDSADANTFLPLTVDYKEKQFAYGQVPGMASRRESNMPTDHEILGARVIDRTIRPLFPASYFCETQIVAELLSYAPEVDPETLSVNAVSAALATSPVPWNGPAAAVRVGWRDGAPYVGPSRREMAEGPLDLLYAGGRDKAVMVEVAACELEEDALKEAFHFAHEKLQSVLDVQDKFISDVGVPHTSLKLTTPYPTETVVAATTEAFLSDAKLFWRTPFASKHERAAAQSHLMGKLVHMMGQVFPNESAETINLAGDILLERAMRDVVIESHAKAKEQVDVPASFRLDGRGSEDVRTLTSEVDVLPAPHGSSIFSRGDTQALCTVTLGPPHLTAASQSVDMLPKSFFLHYEFPPYCVNEVGRLGVNRRMVGHGALAEKAVAAVMPSTEDFAYTVRATSSVTGSDGSSSMATVCGTTLALLDAGVNIPHVAGISVGLVTPLDNSGQPVEDGEAVLLTDILGLEDHFGDMDFKVAGTRKGITAVQLDIKLNGVPLSVLDTALDKAKVARDHVLDHMEGAMPGPRSELKDTAPKVHVIAIAEDKRPAILANGAANLKAVEAATGARLALDDRRSVLNVWAPSPAAFKEVEEALDKLLNPPVPLRVGHLYTARVAQILDFGLRLEIVRAHDAPVGSAEAVSSIGMTGLLHISHWQQERSPTLRGIVAVDDEVVVKVLDVDGAGQALFSQKDVETQKRQHTRIGALDEVPTSSGAGAGNNNQKNSSGSNSRNKNNQKKPHAGQKSAPAHKTRNTGTRPRSRK